MATWKVTFEVALSESCTLKVAFGPAKASPSTTATSATVSTSVLSVPFWIVPVPTPSARLAFALALRFTVKTCSGSWKVSPMIGTVIVLLVSPGAKMSVPEVAM